jgi:hypothetical protein
MCQVTTQDQTTLLKPENGMKRIVVGGVEQGRASKEDSGSDA